MRISGLVVATAAVLIVLAPACGGSKTVLVESTPRPETSPPPQAPPPPPGPFTFEVPEAEWTPARIGSDNAQDLTRALQDTEAVAMVVSEPRSAVMEEEVFRMVKAAAPETKVVARGKSAVDTILVEKGEIPYRVTMQPAGADVLGRPFYLPKEHPLSTDWLQKRQALKGATALLYIGPVEVKDERLKELRRHHVGGCDSFVAPLKETLGQADAYFSPYKSAVDDELGRAFARHLEVALPFWREETEKLADVVEPGSGPARCLTSYKELLKEYEDCLDKPCRLAPQVFLSGTGIVGMRPASTFVPPSCPPQGIRDYKAELTDLASRAMGEMLPALDGAWISEIMRRGGLASLVDGLEEICAPRHRRTPKTELEQARGHVDGFLQKLGAEPYSGSWELSSGQERVTGIGPVRVLGRVRTSGANPVHQALEVTQSLKKIDRCTRGDENTLQAALIDVGSSEVLFMGTFFDEELLCEGLPPGGF